LAQKRNGRQYLIVLELRRIDMAYEDIITLGNEEFTTGANGELINLDDLSDEELAELMGEDDIFDDEVKG
jgi:hypothetical protein